jgi:hypothetical protein
VNERPYFPTFARWLSQSESVCSFSAPSAVTLSCLCPTRGSRVKPTPHTKRDGITNGFQSSNERFNTSGLLLPLQASARKHPAARMSSSNLFSASSYSSLPLPYLLLLALSALFIASRVRRFYRHDLLHLPGPFLAKFSGLYRLSMVGGGKGPAGYRRLHQEYGPIVRVGPNHVAVSDPAAIPVIYGLGSNFMKVRSRPFWA